MKSSAARRLENTASPSCAPFLLQFLLSWKGLSCDLPSSQAVLFWIRETLPEQFHTVLARAKA